MATIQDVEVNELQGPALCEMLSNAILDMHRVSGNQSPNLVEILGAHEDVNVPILENDRLIVELVNTLRIDTYVHDFYNGYEQIVFESDCSLQGPIREANEADFIGPTFSIAVARAVIGYVYGNTVDVDKELFARSPQGTGIFDQQTEELS